MSRSDPGSGDGGERLGTARHASPQEMAAIVAAVEMVWPRPVVAAPTPVSRPPVWRFSGRGWLPRLPVAADRHRP